MRILIFGPNGSGKGTQSSFLVKKFGLAHVESGGIFRENIKGGTELGKKAKAYIDRGELVPDEITIPMILDRLAQEDCRSGWILDGFPRNPDQANALIRGLEAAQTPLDVVVEIQLAEQQARARLLGRRSCPNGHPNNLAIAAIKPTGTEGQWACRQCNSPLTVRKDDIDEAAIDVRLNIYFDETEGTLASVAEVKSWAATQPHVKLIEVDGEGDINSIRSFITERLSA